MDDVAFPDLLNPKTELVISNAISLLERLRCKIDEAAKAAHIAIFHR